MNNHVPNADDKYTKRRQHTPVRKNVILFSQFLFLSGVIRKEDHVYVKGKRGRKCKNEKMKGKMRMILFDIL